jgi:hypothetical protein
MACISSVCKNTKNKNTEKLACNTNAAQAFLILRVLLNHINQR